MKLTPLQRRAAHRERNKSMVDLNLVSLIDVFTILIFFLLSSSTEIELLPSSRAVKLPESTSEKAPRETVVVTVTDKEIVVQGRTVALVADVVNLDGDIIAPLKAELDQQRSKQVVQPQKEGQSRAVTIMGDKDIPYRLLRKIMVTCARADYSDVSFAVRRRT